MIIAFGHKKLAGKDTACNYLKYNYKFTQRAFATSLKRATKGMLVSNILELETEEQKQEISPILGITYRRILQKMGDCLKKEFGEDIFCKILDQDIKILREVKNIAISDLRSKTEFEYIQSVGGYCVKIIRPSLSTVDTHRSEVELDSISNDDWDYIIHNDGDLVQLTKIIDEMMKHFGWEEPKPENQEE